MSGEQLSVERNLKTPKNSFYSSSGRKPKKISGRVDINHLMSKVRDGEKKQRKEDLIFLRPNHGIDARDYRKILGKKISKNTIAFKRLLIKK